MYIPPDFTTDNKTFTKKIEGLARSALRRHGFSDKDAPDIVQEMYIDLAFKPDPKPPVTDWESYLKTWLHFKLLNYSRAVKRSSERKYEVSLDQIVNDSPALIMKLRDAGPDPEKGLLQVEEDLLDKKSPVDQIEEEYFLGERQELLVHLASLIILELSIQGKFSDSSGDKSEPGKRAFTVEERVECFYEVVVNYIRDPGEDLKNFNKCRKRVVEETGIDLPDKTAYRWWGMVREQFKPAYEREKSRLLGRS
jgi:DNA-directed RNA polymerase specialized sigma24 family protein